MGKEKRDNPLNKKLENFSIYLEFIILMKIYVILAFIKIRKAEALLIL
jgi:hypothetical protein